MANILMEALRELREDVDRNPTPEDLAAHDEIIEKVFNPRGIEEVDWFIDEEQTAGAWVGENLYHIISNEDWDTLYDEFRGVDIRSLNLSNHGNWKPLDIDFDLDRGGPNHDVSLDGYDNCRCVCFYWNNLEDRELTAEERNYFERNFSKFYKIISKEEAIRLFGGESEYLYWTKGMDVDFGSSEATIIAYLKATPEYEDKLDSDFAYLMKQGNKLYVAEEAMDNFVPVNLDAFKTTDSSNELIQSDSKEAFNHNLKVLLDSGKPRNQALAIAYSIQRKNGGNTNQVKNWSLNWTNEGSGESGFGGFYPKYNVYVLWSYFSGVVGVFRNKEEMLALVKEWDKEAREEALEYISEEEYEENPDFYYSVSNTPLDSDEFEKLEQDDKQIKDWINY